jgi:hypothetical protein
MEYAGWKWKQTDPYKTMILHDAGYTNVEKRDKIQI